MSKDRHFNKAAIKQRKQEKSLQRFERARDGWVSWLGLHWESKKLDQDFDSREATVSGIDPIKLLAICRRGRLNDGTDGTPALREYKDGRLIREHRFLNGKRQDSTDGKAALREYVINGNIYEEHYKDDKLNNSLNGIPAKRTYDADGIILFEKLYTDDKPCNAPDGSAGERFFDKKGRIIKDCLIIDENVSVRREYNPDTGVKTYEGRFKNDNLNDWPDGTAAVRQFNDKGYLIYSANYKNGEAVQKHPALKIN